MLSWSPDDCCEFCISGCSLDGYITNGTDVMVSVVVPSSCFEQYAPSPLRAVTCTICL